MKEFIVEFEETAIEDDEGKSPKEQGVEFKLVDLVPDGTEEDGVTVKYKKVDRVLTAYPPNDGQMAFLLATTGRGQSNEQRFAGIINIMLSCLDENDADYFEGRLLSRDPRKKLGIQIVESIFAHLTEEWFGHPTDEPSGSAG